MTEANGTVDLLPYSRASTQDVVKHARDKEGNDLVGHFGKDPGDPVIMPASSIVCFTSTLFHVRGLRLMWSQSSSALGAHQEVECGRPEIVARSDRSQRAYPKVLERKSGRRCRIEAELFVAGV